jgi:rSAM/selenodomain-associated transferase 2
VSGIRASVVIPALNERDIIACALDSTSLPGVERIVVDGGSSDGTAEVARSLGAEKVIRSTPGRARQMDVGYREAQGDVIVFLHADTRLGVGWLEAIGAALEDGGVAGGAFRLAFASRRPVYRLLEFWVRVRSRIAGLPFGDQALFLRRELIDAQGGIRSVPIFEDLDLVRLIRSSGRLALLPEQAWTSTRRYERNGLLRQGLRNHAALLAWHLGLDRDRVEHWYRRRPAR